MSDYTPTTEEVASAYVWRAAKEYAVDEAHSGFDRWLAAHDTEVRADEREKAAEETLAYALNREAAIFRTIESLQCMTHYSASRCGEDGSCTLLLADVINAFIYQSATARGDGSHE